MQWMPKSAPRPSSGVAAVDILNRWNLERRFARCSAERRVALAVSGGSDSMALLRLVHAWQQQAPQLDYRVVTVDHGLRPGSAAEAQRVAVWCRALGVPHQILVWKSGAKGPGLQARARQARYDLMAGWCEQESISLLLTAHTMDDQAETVLMRQQRTGTDDSLSSIWPERLWGATSIHRPLLDLRRDRLRAYLNALGQEWIDDPSNDDPVFERTRMRQVLTREREKGADRVEVLAGLADQSWHQVKRLHHQACDWAKCHLVIVEAGYFRVHRQAFSDLERPLRSAVTSLLIRGLGRPKPSPGEIEALSDWLADGQGRRTLAGLLFALRRREYLVGREPRRIDARPYTIPPSAELFWDSRFTISAPAGSIVLPVWACGRRPAGQPDTPSFVRQGLPMVCDGKGDEVPAILRFTPNLRYPDAWN